MQGNEVELQEDQGGPGLLPELVSFLQDKDHLWMTRVSPLSTPSSDTESEEWADISTSQNLFPPWFQNFYFQTNLGSAEFNKFRQVSPLQNLPELSVQ